VIIVAKGSDRFFRDDLTPPALRHLVDRFRDEK
jgi:hypothetical protein